MDVNLEDASARIRDTLLVALSSGVNGVVLPLLPLPLLLMLSCSETAFLNEEDKKEYLLLLLSLLIYFFLYM